MKEFDKKRKKRRLIYSLPVLFILLIVVFVVVKGAVRVVDKQFESRKYSQGLEEKMSELSDRERELREGIDYLQTEEGVKEEIRERFSVAQEGELVALIIEDPSASDGSDDDSLPWYKKLWSAIIRDK